MSLYKVNELVMQGYEDATLDVRPGGPDADRDLASDILSYADLPDILNANWAKDLREALTEAGHALWDRHGREIIARAASAYIEANTSDTDKADALRVAVGMLATFERISKPPVVVTRGETVEELASGVPA